MSEGRNENRLEWLDSLRGVACLTVVFAHIIATDEKYGKYASGCGKIGVWLFFVISGFLAVYPLSVNKKSFGMGELRKWYPRKLMRLYPAYIIAVLLAAVSGFLSGFRQTLRHIFLLEGSGHFWYMPVIICFYLFVPFLLLILSEIFKKKQGRRLAALLLLLTGLVLSLLFPYTSYVENSISLKWYMPVFLMGMLMAVYFDCYGNREKTAYDILSAAALCLILLMTPPARRLLFGIPASPYLQNKYLPTGFLWCLVFIGIAGGRTFRKILSGSKILSFVGKISYEIYLFHYIVLLNTMKKTPSTKIIGAMTLLLGFGIAYAVHCFLVYLKRRIAVFKIHDHSGT